jgi:capsular polysaccharide biosynthesis protein
VDRRGTRWGLGVAAVVVGVAVGVGVGFVVSILQPTLYRSETAFVVQRGGDPLGGTPEGDAVVQTVRDLLDANLVTQVVIRNLSLNETSATFVAREGIAADGSAVLRVTIDNPDQARATQIAQELGVVFAQIVQDRFGTATQPIQVVVFDPAHDVGKVSPDVKRNLGWGALLGGLTGLLLWSLGERRRRRSRPATLALSGDVQQLADALLARSAGEPFQTVLVTGAEEQVVAGIADSLAARGAQALWLRSGDASAEELARLAAHVRYVLVVGSAGDRRLARRVDLVVAV